MKRVACAWKDAGRKPLARVAAGDMEPWTEADRAVWRQFMEQTGTGRRLRITLYAKVCGESLTVSERTMHDYGRVAGMSEMLWELDHMAAVEVGEAGERKTEDGESE